MTASGFPHRIALDPDDYAAAHVGRLADGRQDFANWWVEVQPGNYMAFHFPWDSGEYDT
jgi:hypothetical protein